MQSTNNQQPKTQKAFTLIELLVVIAIVGILAGLAAVNMSGATDRARIVKAQNFAASIQHSMATSLAGEWNFDGQNANDSSGNNNNGTVSGAYFSTSTPAGNGIAGQYSLGLDGSNDYVEVPQDGLGDSISVFSVSVWAKAVKVSDYGYIVHRSVDSAIGNSIYWLGINSSGNYAGAVSGRYSQGNTGVAADGSTWNFLVLTYDGNAQKIYVDGSLKVSYNLGAITNNAVGNRIGFGSTPFNIPYRPAQGLIDDIRIYNVSLTASAIREQYAAGLDKLLANGQITQQDYQQRLVDLNSIYAANE